MAKIATALKARLAFRAVARPCSILLRFYLHAHLALKEAALAKVKPFKGQKGGRYKPGDRLLAFLDGL